MLIKPEVLILSSRGDFSCDYVVASLAARGRPYLRLNSEDLHSYEISFDVVKKAFWCTMGKTTFRASAHTLRSVWFRRAIYLRDSGPSVPSGVDKQIARMQWAAFIRGLMVFEKAKWFNHPAATYFAEQKPVQLSLAHDVGFAVPRTTMTNDAAEAKHFSCEHLAVKGLDTVTAYESGKQIFAFTNILTRAQVSRGNLQPFPVILQEAVLPKTDVRVTVIGNTVFAASITRNGHGVSQDWRCDKRNLSYAPHRLPKPVERRCLKLMARLGLGFGGIDLIERSGKYFFLEVNPTGEWAWLVDATGMRIDEAIARELTTC